MSFQHCKRSLAAHKGYYNISVKAFRSLCAVKPYPTKEALDKSYGKVQKRMDSVVAAIDRATALLEDAEAITKEKVDVDGETTELMDYHDKLITDQCEIEGLYVEFNEAHGARNGATVTHFEPQTMTSRQVVRPTVRLSALDPPAWNGAKADFYTWKKKFLHIMEEANISNELTQLCYLQNQKTLPEKYQTFVSDCSTISDVWSRLEERVPKETIKFEIIAEFRKLKFLPSRRTPEMLREFANEISLFCRRMADVDLQRDNYSCIIMQDVYERLTHDIVLRYRSKISLQRELGQDVEESLDSLCSFLRSEATTLELSVGDTATSSSTKFAPFKKFNALNIDDDDPDDEQPDKFKCPLGCCETHRLIDCDVYMKMTSEKRRDFIKESFRCFVCLGVNHMARNCPRRRDGKTCKNCLEGSHHWTTCLKKSEEKKLNSLAATFIPWGMEGVDENSGLRPKDYAPLIVAEVQTGDGKWTKARCLLDTGSNSSLVRTQFARSHKLYSSNPCYVSFKVAGGRVHTERSEEWGFRIRPLGKGESYLIMASGFKKPCADINPIPGNTFEKYRHLYEVKEKFFVSGGEVDILIGQDYAPLVVPESVLRAPTSPDKCPSVAFTRLGCYLYGSLTEKVSALTKEILHVNHVSRYEEDEMKVFFYGDILGVRPTSLCACTDNQITESAFIKHVRRTTRIDESGRVCVKMPWKPGYPAKLPNNFQKAQQQLLRRENQLIKKGKLDQYNEEIQKLVERGVVRILSPEEANKAAYEPAWYLNHHMVERPDKNTTKLRIVFDSAATFMGVSLNDAFEKGPTFTNLLFRCLLRWRRNPIAAVGDIEKMFNQITMSEGDQKYHRFLWRYGDRSSTEKIFQWLRLIFGDKPSPDLAGYSLMFLAETYKEDYPIGASILDKETYVDDIGFSAGSSVEVNQAITEVDAILKAGKFSVKVWDSNSLDVDQNKDEKVVDVLGHRWNKELDTVSLKSKELIISEEHKFTKRTIMSVVAKLWDPLGYLLPITIRYRIDLQKIWQSGFGWDQPLSREFIDTWINNINDMMSLDNIRIDRCLKPNGVIGLPQLHAFSDGGNEAYGTCIFIRWLTEDGVKIKFVTAKAFVAPLKFKTTPRLELMAALAMCRVTVEVVESLEYQFEFKRFWIDSLTVVYWLMSLSSRYKPFVSTRIQEFQDTHGNWREEIRYVPSEINPADCLTKPIPTANLSSWHEGKLRNFLELEEELWPQKVEYDTINTEPIIPLLEEKGPLKVSVGKRRRKLKIVDTNPNDSREISKEMSMTLTLNKEENEIETFGLEMAEQFSSWSKLLVAVAYLKRSFESQSFNRDLMHTPDDIIAAEKVLFLICQRTLRKDLNQTKKRFLKLNPVVDNEGIIRAGGRLQKVDVPDEVKHPILLPGEHSLVRLFATEKHKEMLHQGHRVIMANLMNTGIHIGGGRELLKSIANRCIFCKIRRRKLLQQMMGDLPSFRIEVRKPPFTAAAVDFF